MAAYKLMFVGKQTTVSLKLDKIMRELMDDNCVWNFFNQTISMDPETAVTCTSGHFNQIIFAVSFWLCKKPS